MKKLLLAIALFAAGINGANAQEGLQKAKFLDNWYLGVKGGATTPMTFNSVFPLNPTAGIKLGKNFSPVFGANFEVSVLILSTRLSLMQRLLLRS